MLEKWLSSVLYKLTVNPEYRYKHSYPKLVLHIRAYIVQIWHDYLLVFGD
jgi:hypothetical protein